MVNVPDEMQGLNPKDFLNQAVEFDIACVNEKDDCLDENERPTRDGKRTYKDFTLGLVYPSDAHKLVRINYLFPRDLSALKKEFGADSQKWTGKKIIVGAKTVEGFYRWDLKPKL